MHLSHFRDRKTGSVKMLEIGVQSGGSTRIWSQYFGSHLDYLGIDINPGCAQFASPSRGIKIEIGSQRNASFLQDICTKYGKFDIIIDDGAHDTSAIFTSFYTLFTSCMNDGGVYAVEDTHSEIIMKQNYPQLLLYENKDFFWHIGNLYERMLDYWKSIRTIHEMWAKTVDYKWDKNAMSDPMGCHISSISLYDSMVFFHFRKSCQPMHRFVKGKVFIPTP